MAASRLAKVGRIIANNSVLFICDMQEKLGPSIRYFPEVCTVTNRMLRAYKFMDLPVIATEQYPKGLGRTVPEVGLQEFDIKPFEKTQFSMLIPDVENELKKMGDVKSIILCGIETHACIFHTALSLIEKGYDTHVIVDACSSRSLVDRKYAFKRISEMGGYLTTSETVILGLTADSAHPKFRGLQKIIWDSAPETGLLKWQ